MRIKRHPLFRVERAKVAVRTPVAAGDPPGGSAGPSTLNSPTKFELHAGAKYKTILTVTNAWLKFGDGGVVVNLSDADWNTVTNAFATNLQPGPIKFIQNEN